MLRIQVMHHPEWLVWCFSITVWLFFALGGMHVLHISPLSETNLFSATVSSLWPWGIMVIAMMFPLLNEPVRHVAFSVSSSRRRSTIMIFLLGYTTFWLLIGSVMISAYTYYQFYYKDLISVVFVGAMVFLLAGALIWTSGRRKLLTACSISIPIQFNSRKTYTDALAYGWIMGKACFKTCWAPMLALVLCHHDLWLMSLVTIGMLLERYKLPHKSTKISYYWVVIGLALTILTWQNMNEAYGTSGMTFCGYDVEWKLNE